MVGIISQAGRSVIVYMVMALVLLLIMYEYAPDLLSFIGDYFTVFAFGALILLLFAGKRVSI